MMKRFFAFLMTVCCSLLFFATAYGDTLHYSEAELPNALSQYCSVQNRTTAWSIIDDSPDAHGNYAYYSEDSHTYTLRRWYYCLYCGAGPVRDYRDYTMVESHHLKYDTDGGHVEGTTLHLRNRNCVNCGDFSIQYTCFGPPCTVNYRLDCPVDIK